MQNPHLKDCPEEGSLVANIRILQGCVSPAHARNFFSEYFPIFSGHFQLNENMLKSF